MKLLVGLGNPGEKYKDTRHNIGFVVVDALVSQVSNFQYPISNWVLSKNAKALYCNTRIKGQKIEFIKPQSFMNESGHSVRYAYKKHSIKTHDLYVIHDDLDIKLGEYKIQKGVGPKLHYGISSIEKELGMSDFWRVRIGVDNRANDKEQRTMGEPSYAKATAGKDYVLQNFSEIEVPIVSDVVKEVVMELTSRLE